MPQHAIEALMNFLQSLRDDEPKSPLHVGEVMTCWTYLTTLTEAQTMEQIGLNSTTEPELKKFLERGIAGAASQSRRLRDFLQHEGVPLPPTSEPRPVTDPLAVPMGAKMTDEEIANLVSVKVAGSITACATGAAQSIRNDVGSMFIEFQSELMTYGISLKTFMRKRAWLKVPPYYNAPGVPTNMDS